MHPEATRVTIMSKNRQHWSTSVLKIAFTATLFSDGRLRGVRPPSTIRPRLTNSLLPNKCVQIVKHADN